MLSNIMKSCKILNDKVMVRLPIKRHLLELILFALPRFCQSTFLAKLYAVIFSVPYYGLLQIGEITTGLHPIKAKDVHVGNNKKKIMKVLYSSKAHGKESRPQKIKIKEIEGGNKCGKIFCPFVLMREYMKYREGIYEVQRKLSQ